MISDTLYGTTHLLACLFAILTYMLLHEISRLAGHGPPSRQQCALAGKLWKMGEKHDLPMKGKCGEEMERTLVWMYRCTQAMHQC